MMSTDNYPPGAANNPYAPYNEDELEEIDVTISITCSKSTTIHVPKDWREQELSLTELAKAQVMPPFYLGRQWVVDDYVAVEE
jgi:hypothetical protein